MSGVVLYDDARARTFEPFALTRPASALRVGARLIYERWRAALGNEQFGILAAPHLDHFGEFDGPRRFAGEVVATGTVVVNARFAPALGVAAPVDRWTQGGRTAAVRLARDVAVSRFEGGRIALEDLPVGPNESSLEGWWLEGPWDAVRLLADTLVSDIPRLALGMRPAPPESTVIGSHPVHLGEGATVEPYVVFDTTTGPILLDAGVKVSAFTRLVGPCYIGRDTHVLGGKVSACSIGEVCRVHGELSSSIFLGHANKGHDGFVGHSILGRWTNLGASTVTSNLKNTYGSVSLWTPNGPADTRLQFLGTLLGDHAKTAIGTRLMTGTVVGAGASVVADGSVSKVIAPFAFGRNEWRLEKFVEVAERVMARRHVTLSDTERAHLHAAYAARWRA